MHCEHPRINQIFKKILPMFQERTFVIAVIIGIAVIISTISLLSLPLNSDQNEWWSYDAMRDKMIQTESNQIIELEEDMKFQSEKDGT